MKDIKLMIWMIDALKKLRADWMETFDKVEASKQDGEWVELDEQ